MEPFIRDLQFGLRQLLKHPVITIVAAVALGLGIGSVTTQLSVTKAIFLSGLPFPDSDRIAHLKRVNVMRDSFVSEVPIPEFVKWREEQEAFEGLAGFYAGTANLTFGNKVERYAGCFISANAFELIRADALLGRTLVAADDKPEAPEVVVLSYGVWQRDFGGDPEVIGQEGILNGRPVTVVGVMPRGFGFPINEEIWIPLFKQQPVSKFAWDRPAVSLGVFGRLKPEFGFEKARASMSLIAQRIANAYPGTHEGFLAVDVKPFISEYMAGGQTIPLALTMLLITVLILVIACANVANLLLARSMRRQKEIAIRSALGATRNRIISQFLTESILLATIGALLGVFLALDNIRSIQEMTVQMDTPFWMDFTFDGKVFIGVTFVTLLTGVLSGLVPALRASKINENDVLKDDTRTGTSLHMGAFSRILVVVQISVAAVVLTLVILFIQSTRNALSLDYAYNPDETITARIGLFEDAYPDSRARAAFVDKLLDNLRAHPGIETAAITSRYQFIGGSGAAYDLPGTIGTSKNDRRLAYTQRVSPEFFETLQMPILAGRAFRKEDFTTPAPRHAIINRAFAEREWGGREAIGQRFRPDTGGDRPDGEELPWVEVVGIVGNMQESGVFGQDDDGSAFFLPQTETEFPTFLTVLVRGAGNPQNLLPVLRGEIMELDRNLPLYETGTPREVNDRTLAQYRFFSSIFTSFGVVATFLAAVGVYGVITFSVNQRVMEFGIRQALGATRTAVFKLVYQHAFKQIGYGFLIALMLLSPLILSPGLRSSMTIFFYEIDPDSLVPYLLSFGFVAIIAVLSAAPPAFRASRIHPAQALRYE